MAKPRMLRPIFVKPQHFSCGKVRFKRYRHWRIICCQVNSLSHRFICRRNFSDSPKLKTYIVLQIYQTCLFKHTSDCFLFTEISKAAAFKPIVAHVSRAAAAAIKNLPFSIKLRWCFKTNILSSNLRYKILHNQLSRLLRIAFSSQKSFAHTEGPLLFASPSQVLSIIFSFGIFSPYAGRRCLASVWLRPQEHCYFYAGKFIPHYIRFFSFDFASSFLVGVALRSEKSLRHYGRALFLCICWSDLSAFGFSAKKNPFMRGKKGDLTEVRSKIVAVCL